jgi:sugar-phosphatase
MDDVADVTALPGTRELLTSAPSGQVAVVTSATRPLAEVRLRTAGLLDLMVHLVTAKPIQRAKPDPQPYVCGAAKLQLAPDDCVVIEDAPNGVRSGKAAGARVIAVRTTPIGSSTIVRRFA